MLNYESSNYKNTRHEIIRQSHRNVPVTTAGAAAGVAALAFAGALPHRLAKDDAAPVVPAFFFPVATLSVTGLAGIALVVELFAALSSLTTAPPTVFLTAASFWATA